MESLPTQQAGSEENKSEVPHFVIQASAIERTKTLLQRVNVEENHGNLLKLIMAFTDSMEYLFSSDVKIKFFEEMQKKIPSIHHAAPNTKFSRICYLFFYGRELIKESGLNTKRHSKSYEIFVIDYFNNPERTLILPFKKIGNAALKAMVKFLED